MLENLAKLAICQIKCGQETGTGWLISPERVITAMHCVSEAIETGESISLLFLDQGECEGQAAKVVAFDDDLDVALLSLTHQVEIQPLLLSDAPPREGGTWISFGYPHQKAQIGHRIVGSVSQLLREPTLRLDVDLVVDPATALSDYAGLSGAPLLIDGKCAGILRMKIDRSLGAISIEAVKEFLKISGIVDEDEPLTEDVEGVRSAVAERSTFQSEFEEFLLGTAGEYAFLEGAHGIGKTTFCDQFVPLHSNIFVLGAYNLTLQGRGAGPMVRAQPEVFYDWLLTTISTLITGKADRKADLKYAEMVEQVEQLLSLLSRYCEQRNVHGVLFVDGVNEGQSADASAFGKLVGLLPLRSPKNITVVFTAPNFNAVSTVVTSHVASKNVRSLPRLTDESCIRFCRAQLWEHADNSSLLDLLCQKAQGHPLYLRYLIEYVNETQDISLQDFPTLSGPIEDYYEAIWAKLLMDTDAVHMLGIMARLRWGISVETVVRMLSESEKAIFVPTLSRIRHLLREKESTEIYHSSFSDFICEKTAALESTIHDRIASFCLDTQELDYCVLNKIFHLLNGGEPSEHKAIAACQQQWIDECVILGVNPDTVQADIEATLSIAIHRSQGTEVIRLLLLQQRVGFRYNVLFTQSAHLIANALIAIKRPDEAVRIALRFDVLVVNVQDALSISYALIKHGYIEQAFQILKPLHRSVSDAYNSETESTVDDFVELSRLLIQINLYGHLADGHPRYGAVGKITQRGYDALTATLAEASPGYLEKCIARIQSMPASVLLYARGQYANLAKLREFAPDMQFPPAYFLTLLSTLFEYGALERNLGYKERPAVLSELFSDCHEVIGEAHGLSDVLTPVALDVLMEFDAPSSLVRALAEQTRPFEPSEMFVVEKNGVDLDYGTLRSRLAEWRAKSYLDNRQEMPEVESLESESWRGSIEKLMRAVAWLEGRARRAKADNDSNQLDEIYNLLASRVVPVLQFSLAQRVTWRESYALPEAVFPIIWERVVTMVRDCVPSELSNVLQIIVRAAPGQLGLYTEGLRQVFESVVECCIAEKRESSIDDALIDLLNAWKSHVLGGVENRHELVPEILKLIPQYVKLGAFEQGMELYKRVLGVSMGPSWYKEDQFGLLTTILQQMPVTDKLEGKLSAVAGYLQRASGEMTFQRFVRYEKSHFIGELFRRGLISQGRQYFQRQSCGSSVELLEDVQTGELDRVGPLRGMRHPGASLDEQEVVLDVVRHSKNVDWRLRWSLLEIFQCGDKRHIANYAAEYASLVNGSSDSNGAFLMFTRLNYVIGAEVSDSVRTEFFTSFRDSLHTKYHEQADALARNYPGMRADWDPHGTRSRAHAPDDSNGDADEQKLFLPGTFGYRSAIDSSNEFLKSAERQLKLGNKEAGKMEALRALKTLQDGGWSIWGNLSSASKRAEDLILEVEKSASDVVRTYGALIEEEKHTAKWAVANHLIEQVGRKFSEGEREFLLCHAIEHVRLMVGDSQEEIAKFDYLDGEPDDSPSVAFFGLLIWLLDHPVWMRRDNAANSVLWLIEQDDSYFALCAQVAFVSGIGLAGEIARGAIDALSNHNAGSTWERLAAALDLEGIVAKCRDIGRAAVLTRIAERAAKQGNAAAVGLVSAIKATLRPGAIELAGQNGTRVPTWASCIAKEIAILDRMNLKTPELMAQLESELASLCAPLNIEQSLEIEVLLANSFVQHPGRPLGRWEGRVRTALGRVLFKYASLRELAQLESVLRIYNPSAPARTITAGFQSPGLSMIDQIERGVGFDKVIGSPASFYLNYFETILVNGEYPSAARYRTIEVFAALVANPYLLNDAVKAAFRTRNTSTSYLDQGMLDTVGPACVRIAPDYAYFGSFSPAHPTSYLSKLAQLNRRDFTGINWRNGRSYEVENIGTPEREGCLLSVPRAALRIPDGMKMIWIVLVDDKLVCIVDEQNRRFDRP